MTELNSNALNPEQDIALGSAQEQRPRTRIRPVAPLYRAVVLELERRRLAIGISMDRLSEIAGIADRAWAKLLYPDTAAGRTGNWETLQLVSDVLFADGFDVVVKARTGPALDAIRMKYQIRMAAVLPVRGKCQREWMSELGKRSAAARAAKKAAKSAGGPAIWWCVVPST